MLGLIILMRAGLVSFGQGLYFCLGGYAAGMASQSWGVTDALALLALGVVASAVVAAILGLLLARYREIFFAMFTLAFSMILYGVLVEVAGARLDRRLQRQHADPARLRAHRGQPAVLGVRPRGGDRVRRRRSSLTGISTRGWAIRGEAIRENEIRVEYLGMSARRIVYIKYILAAVLAALGGGLMALATGHVDPQMAYWTTSGEFVFIALMGGTAHVAAPFLGALLFELVRTYAFELSPYTWQMTLGVVLLAIILFLPEGLWSLVPAGRK